MNGHGDTETSEDEVGTVLDRLEKWGDSVGESKVESPVRGGGERDGLGTDAEGVDLSGVGPGNGAPGDGEGADEEVGAGDDSVGSRVVVLDGPGGGCVALGLEGGSVGAHETTDEEEPESHEDGAEEENGTTTPAIDEEDGGDGHEDVEDVLDGGGLEVGILAGDSGTLEDEDDVVHGDVHTSQLRPGLEGNSEEDTARVGGLEEFRVRAGSESAVEGDGVLDLLELSLDIGVVLVTVGAEVGKDGEGFLSTALISQPTRGVREDGNTSKENNTRDDLDTPGDTESGVGLNEGATVLDKVLDQDTPGDGPLLEGDNTTTDVLGGNLGLVNGDDHGSQTDSDTVDDTADNKHRSVLGSALDDGSNNPDGRGKHDGALTRDLVTEGTGEKSAKEGTGGHGGDDTTLEGGRGVVEVVLVTVSTDDSGHGRDIETKEHTIGKHGKKGGWRVRKKSIDRIMHCTG